MDWKEWKKKDGNKERLVQEVFQLGTVCSFRDSQREEVQRGNADQDRYRALGERKEECEEEQDNGHRFSLVRDKLRVHRPLPVINDWKYRS